MGLMLDWARAELAAIASKLGRIPTLAEYQADMGVINADGSYENLTACPYDLEVGVKA